MEVVLADGAGVADPQSLADRLHSRIAPKHPRHGTYEESLSEEEERPAKVAPCWLCRRALGTTTVWQDPVPKSRGGRDVVSGVDG